MRDDRGEALPVDEFVSAPEAADGAKPSLFTVLPYIMLPMAMAASDQTVVATALPAIAGGLGDVAHISWIVVANLVAGVVAAPVYGQLRDVLGSRRMMVTALSITMAAGLFSALAPSFGLLVLGRVLQGLGGGGLMTLSQAIIGETIAPRERAKYQGYLAAVVVTASVAGPFIGGLLTAWFGWRSVFLYNVPLGALALFVTLRGPARPVLARSWSFDYPGLILFVGFIAPLLLALDQARTLAADVMPLVAGLLVVAGLALSALVWQERRAFFPLLPIALLSQRTIWMSDMLAACHGASLVSIATLLPLYLHVIKGASATDMGLALLPLMLGIGAGSMTTGRLVSRTGYTAIYPSIGLTLASVFFLWLAVMIDGWSRARLGVGLLLLGASMGTIMGVVQVTVQSAASGKALGSAAASVQISRSIGAAIGTTITGAVLFGTLHFGDPGAVAAFQAVFNPVHETDVIALSPAMAASFSIAFRAAFFAIAGFATIGAVIAWKIPKRRL